MTRLREINHIDVAVHFDFARREIPASQSTEETTKLLKRFDDRMGEIASDPHAVLFYYSAYLDCNAEGKFKREKEARNRQALREDVARIRKHADRLEDRFFLFPAWDMPQRAKILQLFREREFIYSPSKLAVIAYGEDWRVCVTSRMAYLREELNIPEAQTRINKDLSFPPESKPAALRRWPF